MHGPAHRQTQTDTLNETMDDLPFPVFLFPALGARWKCAIEINNDELRTREKLWPTRDIEEDGQFYYLLLFTIIYSRSLTKWAS